MGECSLDAKIKELNLLISKVYNEDVKLQDDWRETLADQNPWMYITVPNTNGLTMPTFMIEEFFANSLDDLLNKVMARLEPFVDRGIISVRV